MTYTSPGLVEALNSAETEAQARGRISMLHVIQRGGNVGMSDDQLAREYAAQRRFYAALDEFCAAVRNVNEQSSVTAISISAVEDFIHDEITDEKTWDERIRDARRI